MLERASNALNYSIFGYLCTVPWSASSCWPICKCSDSAVELQESPCDAWLQTGIALGQVQSGQGKHAVDACSPILGFAIYCTVSSPVLAWRAEPRQVFCTVLYVCVGKRVWAVTCSVPPHTMYYVLVGTTHRDSRDLQGCMLPVQQPHPTLYCTN